MSSAMASRSGGMSETQVAWPDASRFFTDADTAAKGVRPIWLLDGQTEPTNLTAAQLTWMADHDFAPASRKTLLIPDAKGRVAGVAVAAQASARDWMVRPETLLGQAHAIAPWGTYRLAGPVAAPELAAVAWALGAYKHSTYKTTGRVEKPTRLQMPTGADTTRVSAIVEGVHFGRDLINTPANEMGPAELEAAVRLLAAKHAAKVSSIVGDDLLTEGFPLIHAVGRASPRAPRLIDLTWGKDGPRLTLVGKGICFDTGGLDLKPSASMLLMKKDMGGAAAVLAVAHMIMACKLKVRLRVLIAAAENSVAGNAFRPGDVLRSRAGTTIEIGNTDAEGRLVLADALTLADDDKPDHLITMATLTGAARTAVGAELSPFYCDDDAFAATLHAAGRTAADPLWRMPFWTSYETMLDSNVADMNNVSESGFAGSITAALFLRKFVRSASIYAHFDIYGWRPGPKPLGPRGGEVNAARAIFEALR
jgi:leucyl aminopeptidase